MSLYKGTSPYYKTTDENGYLDVMTYRDIPAETDDILFEVTKNYEYRPDLLSFDLYGDVNFWWVFAIRNNSILKDPVYDLEAGTKIYLPKITTIKTALGI
jgi:hypothetical protein